MNRHQGVTMLTALNSLNVSSTVRDRYSGAALERESQLCCPVNYDSRFLSAIPQEVLERDYGCGDPSKYVAPGDVVLDLGSGGGKICFIAAQVVGPTGRVIGVDCNDEMLALARRSQSFVANAIGFDNIQFCKGRIQDLKLDLDHLDNLLKEAAVASSSDWLRITEIVDQLRQTSPLIANDSVDVVVSNCVLNLVNPDDRRNLFQELFRVVKPGGRAVISDIVASHDVPASMQGNADLWSGCISGAWRENRFLAAFEEAGFGGLEILERSTTPWQIVEGIQFRSMTVRAHKILINDSGSQDHSNPAEIVYRGPWKSVQDDLGNTFVRGEYSSVSKSIADVLQRPPYASEVICVSGQSPDLNDQGCCGPAGCC